MTCETLRHQNIYFVLWGTPEVADFDRILWDVRHLVRETGRSAVYIARVPAGAPAPDARVRSYMSQLAPEFFTVCSSFHVVLEGIGFVAAVKRSVMIGLFQLSKHRGILHLHESPAKLLERAPRDEAPAMRTLLNQASSAGMLSGPLMAAPQSKSPISAAPGM